MEVTPAILSFDAIATGVNNQGAACGVEIASPRTEDRPVVWTPGTTYTLNSLPSVSVVTPQDINQHGVVVGSGWYEDPRPWTGGQTQGDLAVVWQSATGEMVLLDDFLPKRSSLIYLSYANAVNDAGEIVGQAGDGAFLAVPN